MFKHPNTIEVARREGSYIACGELRKLASIGEARPRRPGTQSAAQKTCMYMTLEDARTAARNAAELTHRDWCVWGVPTLKASEVYFVAPCNMMHGYGDGALYDTMMYMD
jgi:hypothetical protein